MLADFFGEYLIKQGAIKEEQLDEAVCYQRELNLPLGELAIEKDYLTPSQVARIVRDQSYVYKKFGQIAAERNFLSEKQLHELLQVQSENHIFLGEILNWLGYVSQDRLQDFLASFKRQTQNDEQQLQQRMERLPQGDILQSALNIVREYFRRLGNGVKVKKLEYNTALPFHDPVFLVNQDLNGQESGAAFGLQMPWSIVQAVAQGNRWNKAAPANRVKDFDTAAEVVGNLNQALCKELRQMGYKAEAGSLRFELPQESQELIKICLHSMLGEMRLLYYFL